MIQLLNSVPWWCYSLLAVCSVTRIEYLHRSAGYEHGLAAFLYTLPFVFLCQFGLFYSFRDASSMFLAWIAFTVTSTLLRIGSSHFLLGERVSPVALAGIACVLLGGWLVKEGMAK